MDDMEDKITLPDPENRYYSPSTSVQEQPPSSKYGITLPAKRQFEILVGAYKIYQGIAAPSIIYLAIGVIVGLVELYAEAKTAKDRSDLTAMTSVLVITSAYMIVHNVVGWIGIMTLKKGFIKADLWLHCIGLASWLVFAGGLYAEPLYYAILALHIIVVAIMSRILHLIRKANPRRI